MPPAGRQGRPVYCKMNEKKKILILASNDCSSELLPELINDLLPADFEFSLLAEKASPLNHFFSEKKLPSARVWFGTKNPLAFRLLLPWLNLVWLIKFFYRRYRSDSYTILCLGARAQMATLRPARILKIKTVCLILPEYELPRLEKTKKQLLGAARAATLAVFLDKNRERLLRLGCKPEQIKLIPPAIRLHQHKFQETIFQKIAQAETQTKKFFNVGFVNELETEEQINELELVFQAIKQVRLIIPNIQLIVVGDGRQKKKLLWLAKKMELESLVWLVGEQQHLRKWLDSFDAFLTIKTKPSLNDLLLVLKAMEAELPVIATADTGFEELLVDGVSGLLAETASSEAFAAQLIRLKQDKRLILRLRQGARERVEKQFNLNRTVAIFKEIL